MNLKETRRKLLQNEKEKKLLENTIALEELTSKLGCIPLLFLDNAELSTMVRAIPKDELKIILESVFSSAEFAELIKKSSENNDRLDALRSRKAAKAQRRKRASISEVPVGSAVNEIEPMQSLVEGVAGETIREQR